MIDEAERPWWRVAGRCVSTTIVPKAYFIDGVSGKPVPPLTEEVRCEAMEDHEGDRHGAMTPSGPIVWGGDWKVRL